MERMPRVSLYRIIVVVRPIFRTLVPRLVPYIDSAACVHVFLDNRITEQSAMTSIWGKFVRSNFGKLGIMTPHKRNTLNVLVLLNLKEVCIISVLFVFCAYLLAINPPFPYPRQFLSCRKLLTLGNLSQNKTRCVPGYVCSEAIGGFVANSWDGPQNMLGLMIASNAARFSVIIALSAMRLG